MKKGFTVEMGRRILPSVENDSIIECYSNFLKNTTKDIFDEEGNLKIERNKVWSFFYNKLQNKIEKGNLYRRILQNRSGIKDTLMFLKFDHIPEEDVAEETQDINISNETIASDDPDEKIVGKSLYS